MRTQTQPRVPPGVPTGGRFAAVNRPASRVLGLTDADVFAVASLWARKHARQYGVDPDDLAGEVLVHFYEQCAKPNAAPIDNVRAYINTLARNVAIEMLSGANSATRQAHRQYEQIRDAEMQRLGRELGAAEEDEIAARVIASQKPGRRASVGFHRKVRERRIDDAFGDGRESIDLEDMSVPATTMDLDDAGQSVVDIASRGERIRARKMVWDVLAGLEGVSARVATSTVTERRAAAARRTVAAAGGMARLVRRYDRGLVADQAEIDAIFTPYGGTSEDEREEIVALLRAHERLADDIWDAALIAATKQRRHAGAR